MAHRRDFRRGQYFGALRSVLKDQFLSVESTQYDQVLFNPRRIMCVPPPGPPAAAGPRRGRAAASSGSDGDGDTSGVDPRLLGQLQARLAELYGTDIPPQPLAGWDDLDLRVFDLPGGRVPSKRLNSFTISRELDAQFPGQIAPEYYTVTQQYVQPGEDPEASKAVVGLEVGVPGGGLDGRELSTLGAGVRIAVLDTGVDASAIGGVPVPNQQFDAALDIDQLVDLSPSASGVPAAVSPVLAPAAGHGSFIAGLIHCVAPAATVVSIKVASQMGYAAESDIARGVKRAIDAKVDIINLSLGGYPFVQNPQWPTLRAFGCLERAIQRIPASVAVTAAAGNCGSDAPFYPAAFDRVVGVSALDPAGRLWDHSNYGPWVRACARGVDLHGLYVRGTENPAYDLDGRAETFPNAVNYARWTGTSFAAPLVAAQIAVLAAELGVAPAVAAGHLLNMSSDLGGSRPAGRRIMVDVPGQT
jgi:subtilisin family serine protease